VRRSRVVVSAPAKINLSLSVGAVRDDGFHPLATVYQAIAIYDDVTVQRGDGWSLIVGGHDRTPVPDIPNDETNIAVRAALLLAEHHGIDPDVEIVIHKRIPVAGGLAGGSADGAATLLACDALWRTRTPRAELLELAGQLGSDVPFALVGGTAIGTGRGEVVTPAMTRGQYWWVVLESETGLSTPSVYREFDSMHAGVDLPEPEIPDALMEALRRGDVDSLGAALSNDLQAAAMRLRPELQQVIARGLERSARGAIISGSGPSCLFLCESREHAVKLVSDLNRVKLGALSLAPGPVPGARVVG
jgi:4-diphosphocytidyl-2-C-methyl-D-erythritol kinase